MLLAEEGREPPHALLYSRGGATACLARVRRRVDAYSLSAKQVLPLHRSTGSMEELTVGRLPDRNAHDFLYERFELGLRQVHRFFIVPSPAARGLQR